MSHNNPTNPARDELFSHIQRCGVLQASRDDQRLWLTDTMDFLADRYPDLTKLQLATVEAMGQRYLSPPVPYGAGKHANNREQWQNQSNSLERPDSAESLESGEDLEAGDGLESGESPESNEEVDVPDGQRGAVPMLA